MCYAHALPALLATLGFSTVSLAAETFQLEKTHVDLLFSIDHDGFSEKHGSFRELDGTLDYDDQHPEKSHVIIIVKTASVDTSFAPRDKDLKSETFFDVAKYPEMRFVSTTVTRGADGALLVQGNLTLHGVTRPLTLHAVLKKVGPNPFDKRPTIGFSATGTLMRSEFGMSSFVSVIGDTVTITVDAEFNHSL